MLASNFSENGYDLLPFYRLIISISETVFYSVDLYDESAQALAEVFPITHAG